jgi:hypothetical protein
MILINAKQIILCLFIVGDFCYNLAAYMSLSSFYSCLGRILLRRTSRSSSDEHFSLLLIDEATSSVDAHTEGFLYQALKRCMAAESLSRNGEVLPTMLIVCHRLPIIAQSGLCNKVSMY